MEIYVGKHTSLAEAESVYDQMYAELFGDRKKTRRKPDNRNRAERLADWEEEKRDRKDRKAQYACNHINKKYGYLTFAEERRISAEKYDRADWKLEQIAIAEDAERKAIEADIREWELRRAVEDANRRALIAMQNWLEWA